MTTRLAAEKKPARVEATAERVAAKVPKENITYGTGGQIETTRNVNVAVQPTQLRRPWRTTVRTAFQLATALVTLIPFVVTGVYGSGDNVPAAVAQLLAVDAAIARTMALPQVEQFLRRFVPWLAAAPKS